MEPARQHLFVCLQVRTKVNSSFAETGMITLMLCVFFFLCLSLPPLVRIYSLGLLKSDEQEGAGDDPEVSYCFEV